MSVHTFTVMGKHGLELKGIMVKPKKDPKAVIQIFHGMAEHKERYIPFMEFLAANGYAVYAHDHRKHGESISEEEGYGIFTKEDLFTDVIDDCNKVTKKIIKDYPGKKIVIMGHSMGSIIARLYISRYALIPSAAIIMGTLSIFKPSQGFAPIALAKTIRLFTSSKKRSNLLAKALNDPNIKFIENPRTELDWLNTVEEEVDKYIENPLCGYAYTPQFYVEFLKTIVHVNKESVVTATKDMPMLFISGDHDPVGGNGEGVTDVVNYYKGCGYSQITQILVEGGRHEILNESDKEDTYNKILEWIQNEI